MQRLKWNVVKTFLTQSDRNVVCLSYPVACYASENGKACPEHGQLYHNLKDSPNDCPTLAPFKHIAFYVMSPLSITYEDVYIFLR